MTRPTITYSLVPYTGIRLAQVFQDTATCASPQPLRHLVPVFNLSLGFGGTVGGRLPPSAHACAPATINTNPNAKPHKTFFITPSQCQVGTASASAERCHVLQKPVFIPEFGTRNDCPCISPGIGVYYLCMFTTAREDFERCTLNSVPGILGKLEYLAQLRE